jgi:peroxiredoxin
MASLLVSTGRSRGLPGGRLATLAVVVATAVVIGLVAFLVDQPLASDGPTAVTLAGDTSGPAPAVGAVPPDFSATDTDGKAVSLGALKGTPVWLTFGASWCGDCRAEAPDLEATYEKYKSRGLAVVGVFIEEDATAVAGYAGRVGLTFPMVADPATRIASRYHTLGIPTHVFIGRDGLIREIRIGALEPAEMDRLVASLVE